MSGVAQALANWATALVPDTEDLALAQRSLVDTVAGSLAARDHPVAALSALLDEGPQWAVMGHVLDFDDLHLPSTAHVSVVCVPAVLAAGGDARAYLAAAGVMTRLGTALGWEHYAAGWHTTCTAGAPAAAVGAAVAAGLDPERTATAIALALPGAGGVQRAFGTDAKSLQVGFAVDAGLRAARLSAAGAQADLTAVEAWLALLGGRPDRLDLSGPAVPGGLAIKLAPCCYALQRPISAVAALPESLQPGDITRIVLRTPRVAVTPLIHPRPRTGLQAKFSLEYAVAATVLDGYPSRASFDDDAVRRAEAQQLVGLVETELSPGGDGLLAGELAVEVHTRDGEVLASTVRYPPGSPQRPPTDGELGRKVEDCVRGLDVDPSTWSWTTAGSVLRQHL